MLNVFSARPAETKEAMSNATKGFRAAQQKTKDELPGLSVSVSLDVAAPRVIVPVSSSRDDGFLLLDMGHMLIKGGSVEGGAMAYRGEFSDMNARLPANKAELLARENMDAVIEPFRVKAHAKVGGGVIEPGVVLAMEVMPGVKGVISPEKISGLYQVMDYVTKADLHAFLGLGASDSAVGGGGDGVERMGGSDGLVAIDLGKSDAAGENEPLVLWEWRVKVPTIGLLLVEPEKDATNKDNGLLAEAAGTRFDNSGTRFDNSGFQVSFHEFPSHPTHPVEHWQRVSTLSSCWCCESRHVNGCKEQAKGHDRPAPPGRGDGPRHGQAE